MLVTHFDRTERNLFCVSFIHLFICLFIYLDFILFCVDFILFLILFFNIQITSFELFLNFFLYEFKRDNKLLGRKYVFIN